MSNKNKYGRPSTRFIDFVFFKCRTVGTGGRFIGPEWAGLVYNRNVSFFRELEKMFYKALIR
jgi:hypothetical protein